MFWWYHSIERPGDQTISRVSNQSPDTSLILLLRPLPSRVATPSNPRQWLHMHLENIHLSICQWPITCHWFTDWRWSNITACFRVFRVSMFIVDYSDCQTATMYSLHNPAFPKGSPSALFASTWSFRTAASPNARCHSSPAAFGPSP